jgi:hypothetical protein
MVACNERFDLHQGGDLQANETCEGEIRKIDFPRFQMTVVRTLKIIDIIGNQIIIEIHAVQSAGTQ